MKKENLKNFWETCENGLVQIDLSDENKNKLLDRFKKNVFNHFDLDNKTVIDYGVGGGYFAELILNSFDVKKYIGIDISERSIENAKNVVKNFEDKVEFELTPDSFEDYGADTFFCFACIQHFVTKEYLDDFLKKVNESQIPELYLQIRHKNKPKFLNNLSGAQVYHGCQIPSSYIKNSLDNYEITYEGEVLRENNYQYLNFKKK